MMVKERFLAIFSGDSRKQVLVSVSSLAAGGLFAVGLRFVGSIVQGRFIDPETLGYYTTFTILPGYLFFLHLGVFTSFGRQYPYFIGKKDRQTAEIYAANALGWTILLCGLHGLIFFIPCVHAAYIGDFRAAIGWGTQIVVTSVSLYMLYLGTTFRNSAEFVIWSKTTVLSSIASVLLLPFVAFYHYWGLCLRYSLPEFLAMILAHLKRPLAVRPRFDRSVLRAMILFGAPLMAFGYVSSYLWTAVERTFILHQMGESALGIFAFSSSLCAGLVTVARSISQVFNPRITMLYGSSGENMAATFRYCVKCSLAGMAVMLPLIAVTWVLIEPMLHIFLPRYIDCAPVVRCICWLALVPVIDLPKQLLVVSKQTRLFGVSVVSAFILFLSVIGFQMKRGLGLSLGDIVFASVVCQLVSVLLGGFFSWKEARNVQEAV